MRTPTISMILICAAVGGPVLADEPAPAVSTQVAPASSDPAHAAAPAAAAAAASADASKASTDAAAEARAKETDKRLRSEGYKPAVRNGVTYYCRSQPQLGSHFETKVCSTPDDLERIARDSKEATEKMQFIRTQQAH